MDSRYKLNEADYLQKMTALLYSTQLPVLLRPLLSSPTFSSHLLCPTLLFSALRTLVFLFPVYPGLSSPVPPLLPLFSSISPFLLLVPPLPCLSFISPFLSSHTSILPFLSSSLPLFFPSILLQFLSFPRLSSFLALFFPGSLIPWLSSSLALFFPDSLLPWLSLSSPGLYSFASQ